MAELLFFLEAFCISYVLTGVILRFSLKRRLLDIPNARSSHSIPKPRLGGVAITLAFYVTCATLLIAGFRPFASSMILLGVLGGSALIAGAGLLDDIRGLDARLKLFIQVGAAGIAAGSGIVLHDFRIPLIGTLHLGALAAPATIVWIVAIINFYNFIDGIDGLAAGIGMIASAFLYFLSGMAGAPGVQNLYVVLAGSSFGFLRFNFPPARIFMGDMGSTFIGYIFAVCSVIAQGYGVPAFMTVLLLAGVIGDAALTLVRRALRSEKLLSPHRTHYYQRLTSLGLSHKQVTLLEYLIATLLGVSAVFAFHREWSLVTFLSVIWIGFFLWALAKIRSMEKGDRLLWRGRTLGVAFGDLAFIALSYVLSYCLRLNFKFPQAETASMLLSLPIVLVIRTAVFLFYGLYRGVWRYTTFDDVIRITKAVSVGSALMVVSFTFLFRFKAFPRSAFIIDWFILTVFMAGSRIATRWFHELPSREEISGRRAIIAGTGAVAELILQQVKKSGGIHVIGYLDDRTEMTGHVVHGLKVLGAISKAEEIAKSHHADEIIATRAFFERIPKDSRERLDEAGIRVRSVSDPSDIGPSAERAFETGPCAGRSILVAGNGPLMESALAVFPRASKLILVSDDSGSLERRGGFVEPDGSRVSRYLGVLKERGALHAIVELHAPELVFADFTVSESDLENAVEAYLRTIMFPLERIASEVSRRPGARLVVIVRAARSLPRDAARAAELIILNRFRADPSRVTILRIDREPGARPWCELIASLIEGTGGVFHVSTDDTGERFVILREKLEGELPETDSLYMRLTRSLDEGDEVSMTEILGEMASSFPVEDRLS